MKKSIREYRLYLATREVINFFYIKRTARKNKNTPTWQSFGLRVDWVGRIFTVLNLRKEDVGEEEIVRRTRLLEMLSPINKYLKTLDLHEIMFPAIEKKTDRSYLIVYSPLFKEFTVLYFLRIMFILGILITCLIKISTILSGLSWVWNVLF
ncbi:MAG: hypothetical protein WC979_00880 [Candidatus Pacearchaeota archaeon]|jgi:hypothetical protein|nr:hypothetical protein [Clostridia bacterium]